MLLRKIAITNCRSFLNRAELLLDGPISIVIGPNGGGKTNLLDAAVIMLRRYLFASMYAAHSPRPDQQERYDFRANDVLNNLKIEPHSLATDENQIIDVEIEVTKRDLEAMNGIKRDSKMLNDLSKRKYNNTRLENAENWDVDAIPEGGRITYRLEGKDGRLSIKVPTGPAKEFLDFLQLYEIDGWLRQEYGLAPLSTPMIYLPVNRTSSGLHATVTLSTYNEFEQKRQIDGATSRQSQPIMALAVGRLAQKYVDILHQDKGKSFESFNADPNIKELTELLLGLGYEWELVCINKNSNTYDIKLKKQGTSFLVGSASSGERELLTYLFSIYALNVRDALIVVDEPELHLHPRWQKALLNLFATLASKTGNQFLLATHAPTFVSPQSIGFVSRVYSREQRSHIVRLKTDHLPEAKHLLNIVNSQNNERMFFADEVVLVEGLSDRIFFEAVFDHFGRQKNTASVIEVLSVGGKGLFAAYAQVLKACDIPFSIIADRDYLEQIGDGEIRALFSLNAQEIKKDVIENVKSMDGEALVARIDEAMTAGNWSDAAAIWEYIKSNRKKIRKNLSKDEAAVVSSFIERKRSEGTHVLSLGALEDYLPDGHRAKDLDKLIRFLSEPSFWNELPKAARDELTLIGHKILG